MAAAHKDPNYLAVFGWLTVLTVLEVWIGSQGGKVIPRPLYILLLISMAVVKAVLVALFFMHLRFERRTLSLIAVFPVLLLVILTIALYPDSMSFLQGPAK